MSEAAIGRNTAKEKKQQDQEDFANAFKPRSSSVNFGALKREKKAGGKKKRGGRVKRTVLVLAILILILGGAAAGLYFTGYLDPVLQMVGLMEPTENTQLSLEDRETMLAIKEESLGTREAELDKREAELEAAEAAQQAEQDAAADIALSFRLTVQSLSEEKLNDLKRVSSIYAKMDPAEAASIFAGMKDTMETCLILYYMQPAASALVLEQMDAQVAAEITGVMLS